VAIFQPWIGKVAVAWLRSGGDAGHGTVGGPVPARVAGVPFDEQRLPGVRVRQVPGCGQDLDGADLLHEAHLPVGPNALRDKDVVVAGD
jgi:hypothetical protein